VIIWISNLTWTLCNIICSWEWIRLTRSLYL